MNRDIKVDTAVIDGQGRCAWTHPCNQPLAKQLQSRLSGPGLYTGDWVEWGNVQQYL